MYCPSCGKTIAEGSAFCMHCGKATGLMVVEPQAPTGSAFPLGAPVCPKCGQIDAAQKVSAVISSGILRGSVPTTGVGTLGGQTFSATVYQDTYSATALAAKLAALSGAAVEEILSHRLTPTPPNGISRHLSDDVAVKGGIKEPYAHWKAQLEVRKRSYLRRWEQLCYCARCDGVFILDQKDFAHIDQAASFLCKEILKSKEYEFCDLVGMHIENFWSITFQFVAQAVGPRGYFVARSLQWKTGMYHFEGNTASRWPDQCAKCQQAYRQIVNELEKDGWQKTDEMGNRWWEAHFRRKAASK